MVSCHVWHSDAVWYLIMVWIAHCALPRCFLSWSDLKDDVWDINSFDCHILYITRCYIHAPVDGVVYNQETFQSCDLLEQFGDWFVLEELTQCILANWIWRSRPVQRRSLNSFSCWLMFNNLCHFWWLWLFFWGCWIPCSSFANRSFKIIRFAGNQQPNDKTKQSQYTRKDLNDQDLDEQTRIWSVCQSSTATVDTNTDTADHVTCANSQASPKYCVSSVKVASSIQFVFRYKGQLGCKDDWHDHSIDCNDLTKDDGDKILRPYLRCFYTTTQYRSSCDEDSPNTELVLTVWIENSIPCCSNDWKAYAKSDSKICPCIWRYCFEELTNLLLSASELLLKETCSHWIALLHHWTAYLIHISFTLSQATMILVQSPTTPNAVNPPPAA